MEELADYYRLDEGEPHRIMFNDWGTLLWVHSLEPRARERPGIRESEDIFDLRLRLCDSPKVQFRMCFEFIFVDVERFSLDQSDRRVERLQMAVEAGRDGSKRSVARWASGVITAKWVFSKFWVGNSVAFLPDTWPDIP